MFGSIGAPEFLIIAIVLGIVGLFWKAFTGKVAGELPPEEAARIRAEGRARAEVQQPGQPSIQPSAIEPVTGLKKCPFCAEDVQRAAIVCKHCGRDLATELTTSGPPPLAPAWSPGVAAVLSLFIPGAGQLYKGQVFNGLAWLIVVLVGYAMLIVPGLVLHFCCVLGASMGDPYAQARKALNKRPI